MVHIKDSISYMTMRKVQEIRKKRIKYITEVLISSLNKLLYISKILPTIRVSKKEKERYKEAIIRAYSDTLVSHICDRPEEVYSMYRQSSANEILKKINKEADSRLGDKKPPWFTAEAFGVLRRKIKIFVGLLLLESLRRAELQRDNIVSDHHVEEASLYIVKRTGGKHRLIGGLGSAIFGAMASCLVGLLTSKPTNVPAVFVVLIFLIIGLLMGVLGLLRD